VHKIQRDVLNYTHKRITNIRPVYNEGSRLQLSDNFLEPLRILQRVAFVQEYLKIMEDPDKMLLIIDEVGIGTNMLKHYAYSKKGERVVVSPIPFTVVISKWKQKFLK